MRALSLSRARDVVPGCVARREEQVDRAVSEEVVVAVDELDVPPPAGCGFGSPETMRRAFPRVVGVGPSDYRARFRSSAA